MAHGFFALIGLVFFAPIISFFSMRYKAITSWMIYEILQGEDTDVSSGSKNIQGLGFTLFLYALLDYAISSATNTNGNKNNGFMGIIKNIVLSIFKEVWDLIKNFSLPAIVIEKISLKEVPSKLKLVKKNIPGTLVGVLGIDIVGSIFVSLFSFVTLPSLLIGGGIGYFGKSFLPQTWLVTIPAEAPIVINLLPLFICLFGTSVLTSFLNSLVKLVKTTYFTTFYISLARPDDIHPDYRKDVTRYLDFNDRLDGYEFFKGDAPKEEEAYDLDEQSGEDLKVIRKIANTFEKNVAKGISEKRIYAALKQKGYSEEVLKSGLEMFRSNKAA